MSLDSVEVQLIDKILQGREGKIWTGGRGHYFPLNKIQTLHDMFANC